MSAPADQSTSSTTIAIPDASTDINGEVTIRADMKEFKAGRYTRTRIEIYIDMCDDVNEMCQCCRSSQKCRCKSC
jgi:hypothetical protein